MQIRPINVKKAFLKTKISLKKKKSKKFKDTQKNNLNIKGKREGITAEKLKKLTKNSDFTN